MCVCGVCDLRIVSLEDTDARLSQLSREPLLQSILLRSISLSFLSLFLFISLSLSPRPSTSPSPLGLRSSHPLSSLLFFNLVLFSHFLCLPSASVLLPQPVNLFIPPFPSLLPPLPHIVGVHVDFRHPYRHPPAAADVWLQKGQDRCPGKDFPAVFELQLSSTLPG